MLDNQDWQCWNSSIVSRYITMLETSIVQAMLEQLKQSWNPALLWETSSDPNYPLTVRNISGLAAG